MIDTERQPHNGNGTMLAPVPTLDLVGAAEQAVAAYCLELCGPGLMAVATFDALASVAGAGESAAVDGALLRATRATASGYAPMVLRRGGREVLAPGEGSRCSLTPPRLARRANGTLDRYTRAALERHLAECLVCRAAEVRLARAERAFASVLALASVLPATDRPSSDSLTAVQEPEALEVELPQIADTSPAPQPELPEQPVAGRGMVVLPAAEQLAPRPARAARGLRGWRVLIVTLLAGAAVMAAVALLWNGGSSPTSTSKLPPPSPVATPAAAILGTATGRKLPSVKSHRAVAQTTTAGATAAVTGASGGSRDDSSSGAAASDPPANGSGTTASASPTSSSGSGTGSQGSGTGSQPSPQPVRAVLKQLGGSVPATKAPTKTIGALLPTG